ncbi:hypothetical protein V4B17_05310 [Bartonella sp. B23]
MMVLLWSYDAVVCTVGVIVFMREVFTERLVFSEEDKTKEMIQF